MTNKEYNMQNEIYSLYHLTIDPAKFDAFKTLIIEIVAATREEPDTTIYEFVVNAARTEVHIVERYRTEGLLPHAKQTFAPYAARFLKLAKIDRLYVYGETTPEIRAVLDGFGAIYLTPFAGFSR
jgi:quinol monooxygenase YgiN